MVEAKRWTFVVFFAIAMSWLESATVVYLRTLVDRINPYQPYPLPMFGRLGQVELIREAATLVMLFTVGWLAGNTSRIRLGYGAIAFGMWDIFYYVFLKLAIDWPTSLTDWDVLFLLPLPWWGPVIAPIAISALMIAGGTLVTQFNHSARSIWPGHFALGLELSGILLALYVFMADALRSMGGGPAVIRNVLPTWFNWPLFLVALSLMAAPIVDVSRQFLGNRPSRSLP